MYCKHCGKQIADDSLFCEFCGTKVAPAVEPQPVEEPAPAVPEAAPEASPAAAAAGMAFSANDGFTSAPIGGNGFMPGAPAPGVPPVEGFTAAPAAPVEEAVEAVEEAVAAPAEEAAEAVEEAEETVEEAVEETAEAVEEAEETVEEAVEEAAEAVEEAAAAPAEEAAAAPAADGFAQAAPMNDFFAQTAPADEAQWSTSPTGGAAPVNDSFAQAAPVSEGFTQAAPQTDGFTQAAAGMTQPQGMPYEYGQTQGAQGMPSAQSNAQWNTGATDGAAPYSMPQGDYMNQQPPVKKGGKKKFLIPLFIIIGLLVAGGIFWAVTGGFGGSGGSGTNVDPATYKENCMLVPYDELFDELDSYAGENVEFTGEVFEVKEEDGMKYLLTDTIFDSEYEMYYGGTIIIKCNPDKEGMPEVEDWDVVTVYGIVENDMMEFNSEFGDYTVPVIDAQYIDIEE